MNTLPTAALRVCLMDAWSGCRTERQWSNGGLLGGAAGFCIGVAALYGRIAPRQRTEAPQFLDASGTCWTRSLLPDRTVDTRDCRAVWIDVVRIFFVTIPNDHRSLLSLAPFMFLGEISYSIYLLHMLLSSAVGCNSACGSRSRPRPAGIHYRLGNGELPLLRGADATPHHQTCRFRSCRPGATTIQ